MEQTKFILVGEEKSELNQLEATLSAELDAKIETVVMDLETARTSLAGASNRRSSRPGEEDVERPVFRRHRVINQLSAVLAGLRALCAELRTSSDDPEAIHSILDEYIDPLALTVRQIGMSLNSVPRLGEDVDESELVEQK